MINMTKEKNRGMRDVINFQSEEGKFYIYFEKDLNLYFSYLANNVDDSDKYSFIVDKDNAFVYSCFDELYDSVMSERPFRYSVNLANTEYKYPLSKCAVELVHDPGVIDLHSEEAPYDEASALQISKNDDSDYVITFIKGENLNNNPYSVCLRNDDSGYDPYNAAFMIMYNKLCNYDYEQVEEKGFSRTRKR